MRILYQFPLSHFCEKVRWLLDHKELDYIAQNLTPGLHRFMIHFRTGQRQLPVLRDDLQWVADSTEIALYLDRHYPEHTLVRKEPELREQILEIDQLSQELGIHVRRWLFHYILQREHSSALEVLMGEAGMLRALEKFSLPALKFTIRKFHDINEDTVAQSEIRLYALMSELNQVLIENDAGYLVGQRLTLADIAVCSMLAPVLMVAGTPWEIENQTELSAEIIALQQHLQALPLGQYIQRIYDTERNARIDWRGV